MIDMQTTLITQITSIATQTGTQKKKIDAELEHKNQDLQTLEERHRKLLEQQRRYFQAVKEYQEAQDQLAELLDENEGEAGEEYEEDEE